MEIKRESWKKRKKKRKKEARNEKRELDKIKKRGSYP